MDHSHSVSAVVLFLGSLLSSISEDESATPDWLAGPPGRRLAVALAEVVELHRPDTAGRCPDCRLSPGPNRRTCRTWTLITQAISGTDEVWLGREFQRLSIRYASEPE